MARYKHYDYTQPQLLPVHFDRQILPGTFASTLHYRIDEKSDLAVCEARDKNEAGGAPAYDPAMLLQILLCADSQGLIQSRQLEQLCRANVVGRALSAATTPHGTTIAAFVSSLAAESTTLFRNLWLVCDEAGRIGREMCALDGVKLPSNASKAWRGTQADRPQKAPQMHAAVKPLFATHGANDARDAPGSIGEAAERQMNTWHAAIEPIEGLLATHEDKLGTSGTPTPSTITANASAKMPPSQGVLQG
jgi:transposase